MSEANEAADETMASKILKQIVGDKEDNATYRQHIRALIEADFMYIVMVCDGASISLTANGKDAEEWRAFVLAALDKILSKRVSAPDEDGEAYQGKNGGDAPGYA